MTRTRTDVTLATLARVKGLALAAMASAAELPLRPAAARSPAAAPVMDTGARRGRGYCRLGPGLSCYEREMLAKMPPVVAARLAETLARLGPPEARSRPGLPREHHADARRGSGEKKRVQLRRIGSV